MRIIRKRMPEDWAPDIPEWMDRDDALELYWQAALRHMASTMLKVFALGVLAPIALLVMLWLGYKGIEWNYSLYSLDPVEVCSDADMELWRHFDQDGKRTVACIMGIKLDDFEDDVYEHDLYFYSQAKSDFWPWPAEELYSESFVVLETGEQTDKYLEGEDIDQFMAMCSIGGGELIARSGGQLEIDAKILEGTLSVEGIQLHTRAMTWCESTGAGVFFYSADALRPIWVCEGDEPEEGESDERECDWKVTGDDNNAQHRTVVSEDTTSES